MNDWTSSGWKKRQRSGAVTINGLYQRVDTHVSSCHSLWHGYYLNPATYDRQVSGDWSWQILQNGSPYVTTPAVLLDSEIMALISEVSTRTLSKVGRSDANSWETLAEVRKTAMMLRHPIDSWFTYCRTRAGMLAKAKATGLSASNAYLMYRYGISPLLKDSAAILTALRRGVRPIWQTTHGSGTITGSRQSTQNWSSGIHSFTYSLRTTDTFEVRGTSIDTATANTINNLGFEAKSLLTLGWELIPYSFVVDWLWNVGDFLGGLVQSFSLGNLGSCITTTRTMIEDRQSLSHTVSGGWSMLSPSMGRSVKTYLLKERKAGLGLPTLVTKPNFRFDELTRLADAFALGAQQLAGIRWPK